MFDILQYPFFQNALIGGLMIALVVSLLGVFVVMRKEANIAHAISNFIFLGVALSLLLNANYYICGFAFAILGSFLIYWIEESKLITKESTKEIVSQAGIGGGIFLVGFLESLQLNIFNFLFGSILFITYTDMIIIGILCVIGYLLFFFFGRNFLALNISEDMASTKGIFTKGYHLGFILYLSIFIGVSIKIFGILLISAFLVIPANISKMLCKNLKGMFIYSLFISLISVIIGLFSSYYLETSSGATIVLFLVCIFLFSLLYRKIKD